MIRVLQCVNDMHRAGLETMLMNYYRNIDRSKIQFDFLTHRPHKSDYDDEILSLGGKVYYAPRLYPQNYPKYFKWMEQFFKEHPEYKIVHRDVYKRQGHTKRHHDPHSPYRSERKYPGL